MEEKTFAGFVEMITDLIGIIVIVLFSLTFIVFLWNVVRNIMLQGGDEYSLAKGKQVLLWGVIVLTIMIGIWGILALLQTTFFG